MNSIPHIWFESAMARIWRVAPGLCFMLSLRKEVLGFGGTMAIDHRYHNDNQRKRR